MADVLEFAIYGRRAGAITRDGGHLTLVYDDEIPAGAPGAEVLRSEILPRVAALAAHTVAGLDHSARVGGRIVAPYFDELRQVSGGAERDSRGADRLQRPPSGHVMARSARERELAPEPGRVWVEPHRRRGRTVEGHWRNIPGRRG